jgi:hypothetical protein
VGGGGGQPHLHGDPFGSWCLYSTRDYSNPAVHPPQIGWSFDGFNIYGRHILASNLGFSAGLDVCGGHSHGTYPYHYHAQVIVGSATMPGSATIVSFYASTTGPYKCFKGDISKVTNYWGKSTTSYTSVLPDTTTMMCSQTPQYYTAAGITMQNTSPLDSSTPSPSINPVSLKAASVPNFAPSTKPIAPPPRPATNKPIKMPTKKPVRRFRTEKVIEK